MTRKWNLVFHYANKKTRQLEYSAYCKTKLMTKIKAIKLAKKEALKNKCACWSLE